MMKMKIEVDAATPMWTLDECSGQLFMLSDLLAGCSDPLSEEGVTGLCSLVRTVARAVDGVSTLLWTQNHEKRTQDQERGRPDKSQGQSPAVTAPTLTEPKHRTGRRTEAA